MSEKTALVRWDGEMHLLAEAGSGCRLEMDDGGGRPGFSPSELLVVGLAGCTALDVVSILAKKRQKVATYEVAVVGERREAHPKVFTDMTVEHRVDGDPLDPEAVRRAIELSATKYCTVTAALATGVARIAHRYVVRNAEGEHRGEVVVTGPRGANVTGLDDLLEPVITPAG